MSVRFLGQLVVDASVALKWSLRDEDYIVEADRLLADFLSGKLMLTAPPLFGYEVANALNSAVMRNRISFDDAKNALWDFYQLTIPCVGYPDHLQDSFDLARSCSCSVYDASYLSLARNLGIPFVTGDKRLGSKVEARFRWVHWIGEYSIEKLWNVDS